ncbi:hypothetical protein F2Q70_00011230 [Brassica cretica]|uniref:Uncharacterized protein n=1 Tax=Brassica cretica TaxID=69181 RepID=A0A8S9M9Q6_BRACR|nr:hypothetical protein F2Q70_00011230 [Brassica cretica]
MHVIAICSDRNFYSFFCLFGSILCIGGDKALLDGAGALLNGDRALLDGDEAVSRWRRSSLTVALLESQTGKASVVSCYNVLAMEQNNWICLLRGSTKQEEGTSKQWTAKQSNTGVMARMMVR